MPSAASPDSPLAVGLVGAGPWAGMVHAPMLAAGPETRLAGVWARRPEAAEALATAHGAEAVASYDDLLDRCDAVAFAVPPDVQARLAIRAARAGKHLLLEKPLALDLSGAQALAAAVEEAGVVSQLMLSLRYQRGVREFLAEARDIEPYGGRVVMVGGATLGSAPFATPWRIEHGALLDVGPHALDLVDAALGRIVEIAGAGDPRRVFAVTCRHATGAVSQAMLSLTVPFPSDEGGRTEAEVYGRRGALRLDTSTETETEPWETARAEFVAAVRSGSPGPLDVRRGLWLQELLDRAARGS